MNEQKLTIRPFTKANSRYTISELPNLEDSKVFGLDSSYMHGQLEREQETDLIECVYVPKGYYVTSIAVPNWTYIRGTQIEDIRNIDEVIKIVSRNDRSVYPELRKLLFHDELIINGGHDVNVLTNDTERQIIGIFRTDFYETTFSDTLLRTLGVTENSVFYHEFNMTYIHLNIYARIVYADNNKDIIDALCDLQYNN